MNKILREISPEKDIKTRVSELLTATADSSDSEIDACVSEMLLLLREKLKMDVVFVSEFINGKRAFKYIDDPNQTTGIEVGDGDDFENTWCKMMIDEKIPQLIPDVEKYITDTNTKLPMPPFNIGTYLSTPVILANKQIYGTICCFSHSPSPYVQDKDLKNLKSLALLVANKIERAEKNNQAVEFSLAPR